MKRLLLISTLILVSSTFFYCCNTGGSGKAYVIKMRLNKGDTFSQDMQMHMVMNTAGMKMNMQSNTANSFQVMNNTANEKELKMTYQKIDMSMDMGPGRTINSDSLRQRASQNIVGKSVIMKLSNDNEITAVEGFEDIINSQTDSAAKMVTKKMFSKDQLNNMFSIMFSMYPKKPVRVGDNWTSKSTIKMMNMDMTVENKYTLVSVKNGLAEINIDGTIGSNGELMKGSASGMKMDLSGTQKGTITIRMDNGYLHSGSYKMDMKSEMEMMGRKMEMVMNADYTVKGI